MVILKLFELEHFIGTISTPVLHFRSLSNLEKERVLWSISFCKKNQVNE